MKQKIFHLSIYMQPVWFDVPMYIKHGGRGKTNNIHIYAYEKKINRKLKMYI